MSFTRRDRSFLGRWWWTVDHVTLGVVGILLVFGMIMVTTASPAVAERIGLESFYFIYRQMIFLSLATALMFAISLLPVAAVRRLALVGFALGVLALIAVLFVGAEAKGAKRWLYLAGFSLQPSEFVKPCFAVMTAWALARPEEHPGFPGYRVAIGLYALFVSLLILQPDFGMTVTVSAVWSAQLFLVGLPLFWILVAVFMGVVGVVGAYLLLPHVAKRINTFVDPSHGDTYQVERSIEAFHHGGLTGAGPGDGTVKQFLPDSHTDFIFAVVGEEFGAIAAAIVIVLFAVIVLRGFMKIKQEQDPFIMYAVAGLLMQFGVQAIINMGVALHLFPTKGMTLPFISYGGSSVLAVSLAMGMVLALTRRRYGTIRATWVRE